MIDFTKIKKKLIPPKIQELNEKDKTVLWVMFILAFFGIFFSIILTILL